MIRYKVQTSIISGEGITFFEGDEFTDKELSLEVIRRLISLDAITEIHDDEEDEDPASIRSVFIPPSRIKKSSNNK
jgi:hypothetical protein